MKTLADVEPRTAINEENTPGDATSTFRITRSGSYYLTGRFDSPEGLVGIRVLASNVTIDLNGFDIFGDNDGSKGSLPATGIDASLARSVWIRNGRIWNFNGSGITAGERARIENIEVFDCSASGYLVGSDASFKDCTSIANGGNGFNTNNGAVFESCKSIDCGNTGFTTRDNARFERCTVTGSTGTGILALAAARAGANERGVRSEFV